MSRKDTIIIAVLINAGLLLILFATAISSSTEEEMHTAASTVQVTAVQEAPPLPKESLPTTPSDEVDQVLRQWNANTTSFASSAKPFSESQNNASSGVTLSYQSQQKNKDVSEDSESDEDEPATTLKPIPSESKKTSLNAYKEVKVRRGDVLDRIAKANDTTVQEIMRVNKLSNTQLQVGQVLKIPVRSTANTKMASSKPEAVKKEAAAKGSSTASQAQFYVVKSGDNPWLIAKKNHLALDELLRLNDLDEASARRLKPGDKLRIK